MQAYEGSGLYAMKSKRNPITGKTEKVFVKVAKVKRGTRLQYNVFYTIEKARFWYRNRIRTAKDKFFGDVKIIDGADKAGLSAKEKKKLEKRFLYVRALDMKSRKAPSKRPGSIVMRLRGRPSNIRIPVKETIRGKERKVMHVWARLRRGTRVRVYTNRIYTQLFYKNKKGLSKESTKPYFRIRVLSFAKGEKLSGTQKTKLKNRDVYVHISDLGKSDVIRRVYNESIPFGEESMVSGRTFAWKSENPKNTWAYYVSEALEHPLNLRLLNNPPSDIKRFCPKFRSLSRQKRKDFWIEFINLISKPESNFNPWVASDEGKYSARMRGVISSGLMQISTRSLNGNRCYNSRGCELIKTQNHLYSPRRNLSCAIAIFSCQVQKDKCISCTRKARRKKTGEIYDSWQGIAQYWSNLKAPYTLQCNDASACKNGTAKLGKRAKIISALKARLPFCR